MNSNFCFTLLAFHFLHTDPGTWAAPGARVGFIREDDVERFNRGAPGYDRSWLQGFFFGPVDSYVLGIPGPGSSQHGWVAARR